jgi:hypothetical protein
VRVRGIATFIVVAVLAMLGTAVEADPASATLAGNGLASGTVSGGSQGV